MICREGEDSQNTDTLQHVLYRRLDYAMVRLHDEECRWLSGGGRLRCCGVLVCICNGFPDLAGPALWIRDFASILSRLLQMWVGDRCRRVVCMLTKARTSLCGAIPLDPGAFGSARLVPQAPQASSRQHVALGRPHCFTPVSSSSPPPSPAFQPIYHSARPLFSSSQKSSGTR
jgi:hypothetical protein